MPYREKADLLEEGHRELAQIREPADPADKKVAPQPVTAAAKPLS